MEHTRDVLIRQARDILVCTFHGDLASFEEIFLSPAAVIIAKIKQKFMEGDAVSIHFTYYRDIVKSRVMFELRLLIIN